jgi:hypothetical protein
MKRWILLAITCLVVDQLKSRNGWLTTCKGIEIDGQVIFDREVKRGQAVRYRPFIVIEDEVMHGELLGTAESQTIQPKVEESSDTGKSPT